MEALDLLERARQLGLSLHAVGDALEVEGEPTVEAEALVEELRQNKASLLALLRSSPPPEFPCPSCGSGHWWRGSSSWVCSSCHPPAAQVVPLEVVELGRAQWDCWRGSVREIAEALGWPQALPQPHFSIGPGSIPWERFINSASIPDLERAVEALQGLLAQTEKA